MKIPIYHHKSQCWKCRKELEIYYPEELAYKHNLGNVQKVYSKAIKSETIGNICSHCGNYQGNWHIRNYLMSAIYEDDFLESLLWIEADEDVKNELIDELTNWIGKKQKGESNKEYLQRKGGELSQKEKFEEFSPVE